MNTPTNLHDLITSFFTKHLAAERRVSPNTITSYRDAIKLMLVYATKISKKSPEELHLNDLNSEAVLRFLDDLEANRRNSVRTRNARLAAIKSFFRYVLLREPAAAAVCQRVLSISLKRGITKALGFLSEDELKAILDSIDRSNHEGRRNYLLLALMYDTSARVQEVLNLRPVDFHLGSPAFVRLLGKGRQERISPVLPKTARLVKSFLKELRQDPMSSEPIFKNRMGSTLSRFGARYVLRKYVRRAARRFPTLGRSKISPHTLRHTKAMHLLESGVGIETIKEILGHKDISSTGVYVTASLDTKRRALEQAGKSILRRPPRHLVRPNVLSWLESL